MKINFGIFPRKIEDLIREKNYCVVSQDFLNAAKKVHMSYRLLLCNTRDATHTTSSSVRGNLNQCGWGFSPKPMRQDGAQNVISSTTKSRTTRHLRRLSGVGGGTAQDLYLEV